MHETEEVTEATTDITTFEPASVKELMATLEHEYSVLPNVDTPEGFEENRVGLRKLVTLRNRADDLRKELNRPYRDAIKATDDEAKKVITCIAKLERPKKEAHDRVQREIERRKEEEANREQVRINAIEQRVSQIRGMSNVKMDLESINVALAQLESIDITDGSFDEFSEAAEAAYDFAHKTLTEYKEGAEQRAAEAEKVRQEALRQAEQKAEIEKQQAEIEAAKQELADQQHNMQIEKDKMAADLAAEASRKEEAKKAELAAAQKKAADAKAQLEHQSIFNPVNAEMAMKADQMRIDREKYAVDAKDLLALAQALVSLRNSIAETDCQTPEATAVRLAIARSFDDINGFIMESDVVQSQINEAEEVAA